MPTYAIVGSGPLGRATARALLGQGRRVRLVSRSPRMKPTPGLEQVAATAADDEESVARLAKALDGAGTVYHCANAPYHRWTRELPGIWHGILAACELVGARLVIGTNLYAYGEPAAVMDAHHELSPCTRKGRVRAELEAEALDAHEAGRLRVALVRASDFYGPEARESVLGDRFFAPLLAGKPAQHYGRRDVPHSYAYLPDFARAMAAVGTSDDEDLWGRSWIAPHDEPKTLDELEALLRELRPRARINAMGPLMLRAGALFVPAAREMIEMMYEFTRPFVVDSRETTERLGVQPTPLARGLQASLAWYAAAQD